ncbi:MAG: hypothetical protein AAFR05_19230, partial [Bacteroidota bacterium]
VDYSPEAMASEQPATIHAPTAAIPRFALELVHNFGQLLLEFQVVQEVFHKVLNPYFFKVCLNIPRFGGNADKSGGFCKARRVKCLEIRKTQGLGPLFRPNICSFYILAKE